MSEHNGQHGYSCQLCFQQIYPSTQSEITALKARCEAVELNYFEAEAHAGSANKFRRQAEADLAAKEKERLLAIKETADAVADVAVLRVKREVDKYEADVLKADLAAATKGWKEWQEKAVQAIEQLSETQAKLEEAKIQKAVYETWAGIKFRKQEKVIERASMLIHRVLQPDYSIEDWGKDAEAFLGEIGGR